MSRIKKRKALCGLYGDKKCLSVVGFRGEAAAALDEKHSFTSMFLLKQHLCVCVSNFVHLLKS